MTKNYLFTLNNLRAFQSHKPVLVSDWGIQGQVWNREDQMPELKMNARQFVLEHLRGTAGKKGLPRLSVDDSIHDDLFTVAFRWLTDGIDPGVMEVASLIRELEKQGKKIPAIDFGRTATQKRIYA